MYYQDIGERNQDTGDAERSPSRATPHSIAPRIKPDSKSFPSTLRSVPHKIPITISKEMYIVALTAIAIGAHAFLQYATHVSGWIALTPLLLALAVGGLPILAVLAKKLWAREFGSDLLAGISILSSVLLGQYVVAAIIVLMLSGGTALEQFATRKAS